MSIEVTGLSDGTHALLALLRDDDARVYVDGAPHDCKTLRDGCFRCDLNGDES